MKYVIAAILLLIIHPAYGAERGYSVTDFDAIRVIGPFSVDVVTGKGASARASGTAQSLERVSVSVQGRLLTIRVNSQTWGGWSAKAQTQIPAKLRITVPQLRSASIDGSGQMTISAMKGMRLSLFLQGASALLVGKIETDKLVVDLAGSGKIAVAGRAKILQASGSGSATLLARALDTNDAQLSWNSSGNAEIFAARSAKIVSTGSGTVSVIGKPACTVTAVGAGEVICGDASDK